MALMTDAKPLDMLMGLHVKYGKDSGDLILDSSLYRTIVGQLIYLIIRTDISYAVLVVC